MVMGVSGFDFAPYKDSDPENIASHLLIISIHSSVPSIYISHTAMLYHPYIGCMYHKKIRTTADHKKDLDDKYIEIQQYIKNYEIRDVYILFLAA
jgi:hypothetical protein